MIRRLLWQAAYARLCLRSRYDFTVLSAWQEAVASWEHWSGECPVGEPMPPPAEILQEDMFEWGR